VEGIDRVLVVVSVWGVSRGFASSFLGFGGSRVGEKLEGLVARVWARWQALRRCGSPLAMGFLVRAFYCFVDAVAIFSFGGVFANSGERSSCGGQG
jgi:hypothetical protein